VVVWTGGMGLTAAGQRPNTVVPQCMYGTIAAVTTVMAAARIQYSALLLYWMDSCRQVNFYCSCFPSQM